MGNLERGSVSNTRSDKRILSERFDGKKGQLPLFSFVDNLTGGIKST